MIPTPVTQAKTSGARRGSSPHSRRSTPEAFSRFARNVAGLTAHPLTFAGAVLTVVIWAAFGPMTHYSETWQLWINTSPTILTFLMVFLLQNAQTRDTRAVHVKIDELIRAVEGARNEFIDVENLSEAELDQRCLEFQRMHRHFLAAKERMQSLQRAQPIVPVTPLDAIGLPPATTARHRGGDQLA